MLIKQIHIEFILIDEKGRLNPKTILVSQRLDKLIFYIRRKS